MVNETVDSGSLETLAKEIAKCATQADEHDIRAALLVREARKRVDAGEAGNITWYEWAPKNIKLSESRLRELQSIAGAKDPKAERQRLRELNNERVKRHRKQKKTAPLRNGGAATDLGEEKSAAASRSGSTATEPLEKKTAAPLRNGGAAAQVTANSKR